MDKIVPDDWYTNTDSTFSLVDGSPFYEHGKLRNGNTGSDDEEIHLSDDEVESQRKPKKVMSVNANVTQLQPANECRQVNRVMVKNYLHNMVESELVPQFHQYVVKGQVYERDIDYRRIYESGREAQEDQQGGTMNRRDGSPPPQRRRSPRNHKPAPAKKNAKRKQPKPTLVP